MRLMQSTSTSLSTSTASFGSSTCTMTTSRTFTSGATAPTLTRLTKCDGGSLSLQAPEAKNHAGWCKTVGGGKLKNNLRNW